MANPKTCQSGPEHLIGRIVLNTVLLATYKGELQIVPEKAPSMKNGTEDWNMTMPAASLGNVFYRVEEGPCLNF